MFWRRARARQVSVKELAAAMADDRTTYVLDVREKYEFSSGHVTGAVSMPLQSLPTRSRKLPRDRTVHVICQSGNRSGQACRWLADNGFDVVNVRGGMGAWRGAGFPVRTGR